jgi:hypothetical protein
MQCLPKDAPYSEFLTLVLPFSFSRSTLGFLGTLLDIPQPVLGLTVRHACCSFFLLLLLERKYLLVRQTIFKIGACLGQQHRRLLH